MVKHWEHTETVSKREHDEFLRHNLPVSPSIPIPAHTGVYLVCEETGKRLEGIYDPTLKAVRPLKSRAKNRELRLYEDALNNEEITVLAVNGLMGTGKTSTTMKHLIDKHLSEVKVSDHVLNNPDWKPPFDAHKILIAKPTVNAGEEEYGFLPGDLREKLSPMLSNYTQYFDRYHQSGFDALNLAGYVDILPLGFIRGLDAENMTLVIDECQNTKELVTVVSRRAEGSRIILLGDTSPFQIDVKNNTPEKNGLTHIMDLLEGAPYFQYIEMRSLEHIVRSDEARDLVRRLFKKYGQNPKEWKA